MPSERHGIKTAAYKQDLQFYLERKTNCLLSLSQYPFRFDTYVLTEFLLAFNSCLFDLLFSKWPLINIFEGDNFFMSHKTMKTPKSDNV